MPNSRICDHPLFFAKDRVFDDSLSRELWYVQRWQQAVKSASFAMDFRTPPTLAVVLTGLLAMMRRVEECAFVCVILGFV